ncbi:MAG TPA: FAD-linked oxidase C-terminal domain-containing protein [Anaerolineales bacterium]|nr:FAD-linked oxidase C-terminal domain-containing protein [Anaerolineales bacterium]
MTLPPDLIAELKKNLSGSVRDDLTSRILYSTDASIYQIEPLGVVIPRDQADLQLTVELAAKYQVPILPRGSGTSLAGQAVGAALIVDCSRWLDHILEINPEEQTATVEPGVILNSLNKAAAKFGLQFGPDPASAERATMGGVIANNATGAHSILYGMTADHLLSADVLMADGSAAKWGTISDDAPRDNSLLSNLLSSVAEICTKYAKAIQQNYPQSWRNSAGYRLNYLLPFSPSRPPRWDGDYPRSKSSPLNLAPLLAGSEGTLAVIQRVKVNLVPKPKHTILAVLTYNDITAACDDVPRLLEYAPSAIELIPQSIVRLAQSVPAYAAQAAILPGGAPALLVVEFSGDQPSALKDAAYLLHPTVLAESTQDQVRIWNVRKVGLGILASRRSDAKTIAFIEDCAIPVEHLGEFVRGVEQIMDEHRTTAEFYAHASAGCLHIRPILDLKTNRRALRTIAEATLKLTLSLGGSMSSEHGDGLARSEWLRQIYGDEVLAAFRTLKRAADPNGILNPGKILDAPPMDANLRMNESYHTSVWTTSLNFDYQSGLASAIEQCNGQGVCRKFDGTMCPSFQATREEMHSTRGRANLLRAMISSPMSLRKNLKLDESAAEALDLCLACKGCKAECPSGVDMAKLKFAFESEYYKTHRHPLRDYLFGYFHVVSALLAPIAPLANLMMQTKWTRSLIARFTGITTERPFPKYSRKLAKVKTSSQTGTQKILFLSDAFTHYIEPRVEQAAFDLLSRAGYEIQALPIVGAGASLLSKGFVDAARCHAARVLNAIRRLDPDSSMMIVGLEPPEIYSLKHDYLDFFPEQKVELESLSPRVWLLDEFLIRSEKFNQLRVANIEKKEIPNVQNPKIKFQPHCHQRAESPADDGLPNGTGATVSLLRSCGFDIEVIDSGCCGMAGTFGYEAEHYELSQQIGELKFFPAVRNAPDALIVSTGSACRMQVEQGTETQGIHPIVLVAESLL